VRARNAACTSGGAKTLGGLTTEGAVIYELEDSGGERKRLQKKGGRPTWRVRLRKQIKKKGSCFKFLTNCRGKPGKKWKPSIGLKKEKRPGDDEGARARLQKDRGRFNNLSQRF